MARKRGRKPTNNLPEEIYNRNRCRLYYQLKNKLISDEEYNKQMDLNLDEFNLSKKNKSLKSYDDKTN